MTSSISVLYECVFLQYQVLETHLYTLVIGELFFLTLVLSISSVSSVTQSCWTLYDPMDCSTPRLPCPSPTPGAYSNSCPSSWWCHPTILSSVIPFSSHLHSFPASGSFPISHLFTSGGQNIGASPSASLIPMNTHSWFPLGLTGLISLLSVQGTLKSLLQHHSSKVSIL